MKQNRVWLQLSHNIQHNKMFYFYHCLSILVRKSSCCWIFHCNSLHWYYNDIKWCKKLFSKLFFIKWSYLLNIHLDHCKNVVDLFYHSITNKETLKWYYFANSSATARCLNVFQFLFIIIPEESSCNIINSMWHVVFGFCSQVSWLYRFI